MHWPSSQSVTKPATRTCTTMTRHGYEVLTRRSYLSAYLARRSIFTEFVKPGYIQDRLTLASTVPYPRLFPDSNAYSPDL